MRMSKSYLFIAFLKSFFERFLNHKGISSQTFVSVLEKECSRTDRALSMKLLEAQKIRYYKKGSQKYLGRVLECCKVHFYV